MTKAAENGEPWSWGIRQQKIRVKTEAEAKDVGNKRQGDGRVGDSRGRDRVQQGRRRQGASPGRHRAGRQQQPVTSGNKGEGRRREEREARHAICSSLRRGAPEVLRQ